MSEIGLKAPEPASQGGQCMNGCFSEDGLQFNGVGESGREEFICPVCYAVHFGKPARAGDKSLQGIEK